ncbi:hypothetical protein GUJ93_ZPchr0009g69 [Zizania palustris]|uniref:Uncharacterized protein n=1 Tax=Zizania palustris TaxID=103762 RepID=A0A8J5RQK8_ZIZPA|nr:hypothetical protein GUJ93_ZPchr0009g69 [Zizania palustris]
MEERGQGQGQDGKQREGVYLVHSQVRRIKEEEEEARELVVKLQLLETRPAGCGCPPAAARASRPLSPLRRAGGAIPVGE